MKQTVQVDLESTVVQTKDILSTNVDDEMVLMSLTTDKYYGLDPISSHIWQLLTEPIPLFDVYEQLLAEFEVDPDTCRRHLLEFIQKLSEAQLVEVSKK